MRLVVRYLLEGNGETPNFIQDGGYFKLNNELVGISVDKTARHIPSTVKVLTRLELIERIKLCKINRETRQPLTDLEAEQMLDTWLETKGLMFE